MVFLRKKMDGSEEVLLVCVVLLPNDRADTGGNVGRLI
jgi:hypothetical protein